MTFRDYIINVYILTDEILKLIKHKHKTNNPKFSVDYYKRPIGYEIIPASKHDINFLLVCFKII